MLLTGSTFSWNVAGLFSGLTALAIVLLGIVVLIRGRGSVSSMLFLTITLAIGGWLGALAAAMASRTVEEAVRWGRVSDIFVALVPAVVFDFAATYSGRRGKLRTPVFACWLGCSAVTLLVAASPLFSHAAWKYSWGLYPAGTNSLSVFVGILDLFLIGAIWLIWKTYRSGQGSERNRSRLLLIALCVGSLAMVDYLPRLGYDVFPFGFVFMIAFGALAGFAVWKYPLVAVTTEFAAAQILETMKGCVLVVDVEGVIRVANGASAEMLGYTPGELVGSHIRKIMDTDGTSTGKLINRSGVLEQNMVWRNADGARVDVLVSSSFVRSVDGAPVAVVYVASDYTERKRAETALRESEQRYRTLFDANPLPMWVYDPETLAFTEVNAAAIRSYGYSRAEFLSMKITEIRPQREVPQLMSAIRELGAKTSPRSFVHLRRDGSEIDVEVSSFEFQTGFRTARMVIANDVTEHRHAERSLRASEEQYRELFENANDIVYSLDLEGRVTSMNVAGQRITGYSRDEVAGMDIRKLVAQEDHQLLEEALEDCLEEEAAQPAFDLHFVARNGRRVPLEVNARAIRRDGRPLGFQGIARDVSEREANAERFRLLFERNLAGVFRGTKDGQLVECNDALARMFGFDSREDLMADPPASRYTNPDERERLIHLLELQGAVTNIELSMTRRDGSVLWVLENVSLLKGQGGEPDMIEGTIIDITDRKTAQEKIEYQAYHDPLTDLPNRLLFRDRITMALARARRAKRGVAVIFLDIDQFKLVNDTLGHTIGDGLLQSVAWRLVDCVRAEDTVARMGGDEFTILLPDLTDRAAAATVAQKVLQAIGESVMVDGHELFVTTSIGLAIFPEDGTDAETLLKNADRAMYRAKDFGRNNYQFATPALFESAVGRLSLERSLHHAFDRDEFVLHYQPMVEIATGRVVGAEALVRWQHPEFGLMMPDDFIPIAEDCQLIVKLGEWVLRTACTQMKLWHDAGHDWLRIAVNLSPRQFQQRDLSAIVERVLEDTGYPAHLLDLEITESTAMQNTDLSLQIMRRLKEMGIQISIDDFGTGYSSLNYLKRFPIDTVKIDQDFVRDLSTDVSDAAIITAVIAMARALNLRVIAEGVETQEQFDFLHREKCAEMQGFLHSRPLAAIDFERALGTQVVR
jgi:diguanylate cyclase (GGDEF)-like protein/PAS domain S-box-containing protein